MFKMPTTDISNEYNRKKLAEFNRSLGNESFKLGFLESAIEYYTKAIQLNPEIHEYYTNRALCYKKQNKWDLVLFSCTQFDIISLNRLLLMSNAL